MSKEKTYTFKDLFDDFIDIAIYQKVICNKEGDVIDVEVLEVNNAFLQATGYTETIIQGRKLTELFSDIITIKYDWKTTYSKVAFNNEKVKLRIKIKKTNMWYKVMMYSPEQGYVISIIENITESLSAKSEDKEIGDDCHIIDAENFALDDSLTFFSTLIETIPSPIYYKDTDGVYLGCNNYFAQKIAGLAKNEIIGKTIFDFPEQVSRELAERMYTRDRELFAQGGTQIFESEIKCADGETMQYLYNKATYQDRNGQVQGLIGVMIDITSQKQMYNEVMNSENELRKAHEEINSLLSSIDSILIGVSRYDIISHWNRKAEATFGIQAKDILGKKIIFTNIPWEWDKIYEGICQSVSELEPVSVSDIEYLNKDNKTGFLGVNINPITNKDGHLDGFLIYGRDITEKRIMEMQLLQGQKLRSIGELASGIAHEINTPMQFVNDNTLFIKQSYLELQTILEALSELIKAHADGDSARTNELLRKISKELLRVDYNYIMEEVPQAIEQTLDGIKRVAAIVKSLKSFSHPTSDKKVLSNINEIINDAITLTKNEWKYDAAIETHFPNPELMVQCNPAELSQVMINLIINSVHAIKEALKDKIIESGEITVSTEKSGDEVTISIQDNGIGIADAIKNRVFDPFFTTKDVGKGTGQGLSIAYNIIVVNHNGTISFESKEHAGTCFTITLSCQ